MEAISNREALELVGGYKSEKVDHRVRIYTLKNDDKVLLKASHYYEDHDYYWFTVRIEIDLIRILGVKYHVFILGYEAILKLRIEDLIKYVKLRYPDQDLNEIDGYHLFISVKDNKVHLIYKGDSLDVTNQSVFVDELTETEIDAIAGEVIDEDIDKVRQEASEYVDSGNHHQLSDKPRLIRKENAKQKERIKKLENYTCQVCGFHKPYINKKGKTRYIIEADHIIDKSKDGGETIDNLWVLCPNCHEMKSRGLIVVDKKLGIVKLEGRVTRIKNNHLSWLKEKTVD